MANMNPGTVNYNGQRVYGQPNETVPSSIGVQFNTFYYQKKALIEAAKEQYFGQMADVTSMPKNMGKTIKRYHYLPLLDDGNINDQGIDMEGVIGNGVDTGTVVKTIGITSAPGSGAAEMPDTGFGFRGEVFYATGEDTTDAGATTAAEAAAKSLLEQKGFTGLTYQEVKDAAIAAGWWVDDTSYDPVPYGGNLYGSSKDVGTISSKFPALSETGGRVNRVGFKRIELEGSIEKFGFFDEYTQESLDFDTDPELQMHVNREMIMGANEITEDALQIDLLNGAGVVRYSGAATSRSEISAETDPICVPTYEDLMRLSIDLDNNRCPKKTKIITGSRMVDTRTIDAARPMYIGSELIPTIKKMTLPDGETLAFVPVHQYGAATTIMRGEIGSIDQFRIIVVPEMMHWAGEGAAVGTNPGYRETGGNYDVFPMLVVGDASFTTIGFQTDGKSVKFKVTHKKPGSDSADWNDPYGETGFMSIKWYYGIMILRPERIALVQCVAEW
jgi:N4-gp56 family major capsid protein